MNSFIKILYNSKSLIKLKKSICRAVYLFPKEFYVSGTEFWMTRNVFLKFMIKINHKI